MQKKILKHICAICLKEEKYLGRHLKNKHQINIKKYYDVYLKKETEGKCLLCKANTTFTGYIKSGYHIFCSKKCSMRQLAENRIGISLSQELKSKLSKKRLEYCQTPKGILHNKKLSRERMGKKNPVHKQTQETRDRVKNLNSNIMKQLINEGKFTPHVTNSWCRSRVVVSGKPMRSTWEAVFFILNPYVEYEKIRILYYNPLTKKEQNYIVDFVDEINRVLYEIKPLSTKNTLQNKAKEEAALKWCACNNYTYVCISDDFFKQNAFRVDYSLYDKKIYKNMKQFLK